MPHELSKEYTYPTNQAVLGINVHQLVRTRIFIYTLTYLCVYGCFQKYWYPQIIHFNRVFHYKPSVLGYPYFWKHPYVHLFTVLQHHNVQSGFLFSYCSLPRAWWASICFSSLGPSILIIHKDYAGGFHHISYFTWVQTKQLHGFETYFHYIVLTNWGARNPAFSLWGAVKKEKSLQMPQLITTYFTVPTPHQKHTQQFYIKFSEKDDLIL